MQRSVTRLVLTLLAAGVASVLAGLAFTQIVERVPCSGEGLVCEINEAIGAYAVLIWSVLGPLIFGVVLAIARNRTALLGAAILLLVPLIVIFLITQIEHATYVGFEPYRQWRTFLVMILPPALTVLLQYLVLRLVVPWRAETSP